MNLNDLTHWYDFTNKTIIITGGTGVLGGEMACALVGCGANVVVLDRNPDLPEELQRPLDAGPGKYLLVYGDVLQKDSLLTAANTIREHFGRIDALINAAGGNHPQATTGADNAFFDIPQEALNFVLDLNLVGTIIPSQVFGKLMAEQGDGIILNVSSMSALTPITRVPAYSAAKGSVNNFTQWLAVYMAQEYSAQIRVNAVAPGFFLTKQNRFLLTDEESGKLTKRGQQIIDHTPMGRLGSPQDLLGTVLWLLSAGIPICNRRYRSGGWWLFSIQRRINDEGRPTIGGPLTVHQFKNSTINYSLLFWNYYESQPFSSNCPQRRSYPRRSNPKSIAYSTGGSVQQPESAGSHSRPHAHYSPAAVVSLSGRNIARQ